MSYQVIDSPKAPFAIAVKVCIGSCTHSILFPALKGASGEGSIVNETEVRVLIQPVALFRFCVIGMDPTTFKKRIITIVPPEMRYTQTTDSPVPTVAVAVASCTEIVRILAFAATNRRCRFGFIVKVTGVREVLLQLDKSLVPSA
jgi:hypothetical protein